MRVAIVGGGLAGLTCAFSLLRRGIEAVVFEPGSVGGRSEAAAYVLGPEVFQNTFNLIDELGLAREVLNIKQIVGQLYRGRIYRHHVASATGLLHFKGLNIFDKALLPKMALFLARHGGALDFHQPTKSLVYDDESVAEFTRREFSQNILNYIAGPLISTLFFFGSDETSKLLYLMLAKYMHSTSMNTLRGGISQLARRLAEVVVIRTVRVDEVRRVDPHFVVGGETFSHVVIAVPGDSVLRIRGLTDMMVEEDRQFFQSCHYQRALTLWVSTDRPVDGHCYGVSIPRVEKLTASTITFHDFIDPSGIARGQGLLSITAGGGEASAETLLSDLNRIYSVIPASTRSVEFPSAMPKFPPGRFKEIAAFESRRRTPGLFFCGDYLMGPFVEAAITTGMRAARGITARG